LVPSNNGGSFQYAPWTVLILPQLEQAALYNQFDFNTPFQLASNQATAAVEALIEPMAVYSCPSDVAENPLWPSYLGVQGGGAAIECQNTGCTASNARAFWSNGMLYSSSKTKFRDATDGLTNVFLVGETRYANAVWASSTKQDGCSFTRCLVGSHEQINLHANGLRGQQQTRGMSSYHVGGCQVAMGDGSVQFLSENMDLGIYQTLGIRDDGLPVSGLEK